VSADKDVAISLCSDRRNHWRLFSFATQSYEEITTMAALLPWLTLHSRVLLLTALVVVTLPVWLAHTLGWLPIVLAIAALVAYVFGWPVNALLWLLAFDVMTVQVLLSSMFSNLVLLIPVVLAVLALLPELRAENVALRCAA